MQMKHIVISALFIFSIHQSSGQKATFKVQFSEPLAVFQFVIDISNNSGPNANKTGFIASAYNTKKYLDLLAKFENINYFYDYEYTQYPYGNKIGGNTYFLLCKNLIESSSINEFSSKSFGIIPYADLSALTNILSQFVPVFRKLIYKPNEARIKHQIKLLDAKIKETDVGSFIDKVIKFHNSSWDISKPFILNVCPTLPSKSIGATAFFNYAYTRLPVDQKDTDLFLSFMFHESFHIIYDEQSLEFKKEFDKWFKENSSKYSMYAELLFNEAITTALSSGYLYTKLKGLSMPPDKWYNNKYIGSMAHEIYPLTEEYINRNKQIDRMFVDTYIKLYEEKFPEWIYDMHNLMGERFIICENSSYSDSIRKTFPQRSIREHREEISLYTLEEIKKNPVTKLIVVSKNNREKLEMIKNSFAELKDWTPESNSDFIHSIFLPDKTYLIIINNVSKPFGEMLKEIKLK